MTNVRESPFRGIAGFYDGLVAEHGHDHRSCDYGSRESQYAKFRVIAEVGDLAGRSLLDVGCGFADLAPYLVERFENVAYTGIDLSPRMIERARELRPELDLRCAGLLDLPTNERFDVVVANGIFYLLGETGEGLAREMIASLFQHARRAVAFNSLSTWAPSTDPGELHLDPAATLDFCRTLTPRVQLRHDYHDRDFTVYLYREGDR